MQKIIYEKNYGFREMKWRDTMENKIFSYMMISTNKKTQSIVAKTAKTIRYNNFPMYTAMREWNVPKIN